MSVRAMFLRGTPLLVLWFLSLAFTEAMVDQEVKERFQSIDREWHAVIDRYHADNSASNRLEVAVTRQETRPELYADALLEYAVLLGRLTAVSDCEVATTIGMEVMIWGIPYHESMEDEEYVYITALNKMCHVWMRMLNEYTCLPALRSTFSDVYKDSKDSDVSKPMLLAMTHQLDKAHLKYFAHVEPVHEHDIDFSTASEEFPFMDLQHTIDSLLQEIGEEMITLSQQGDFGALTQWQRGWLEYFIERYLVEGGAFESFAGLDWAENLHTLGNLLINRDEFLGELSHDEHARQEKEQSFFQELSQDHRMREEL